VPLGIIAGMPGPRASIDISRKRSTAFAPPQGSHRGEVGDSWEPVAVGPGRPASVATARNGAPDEALSHYPIQPSKVQRPALRDDTLARDRLLDWLHAKIHDRVVLVLADAGYGKTTLLADFAQRTRLRTLWYRLDEDDRDWIAFLNYLVAAGREHDPRFAPTTASMLEDMSIGGPTRDAVIDVFLRELPSIVEYGAVLILDDFHLVDESPDVRLIARELVARAPERLTIVFASRRPPTIPLARLRSSGEVAELGTDDLRFDVDETRRLFSETYGRMLEPDVLADVTARTEGWAASLQLVQAALRDRSPAEIRRFVRGLSGADQELYDYLAEEVVGDLPDALQQFLMRTSILQGVTPEFAAIVADIDADQVTRMTGAAERLTLLTRPSRSSRGPQRYHPLVRGFLEARLHATAGASAVAILHRQVAAVAARTDWRAAAHHYREAGDLESVATVVSAAIPEIMGSGQYAVAVGFVEQVPLELRSAGLNLVRSRVAMQRGDQEAALALSTAVLEDAAPGSQESDHALLNLATMFMHAGETAGATLHLDRLRATSQNEHLRLIADGMAMMIGASGSGNLDQLTRLLSEIAERQRDTHQHYFGVAMLNLAIIAILREDPNGAIDCARHAIEALEETSSRIELSSAIMTKATALMMLGQVDEADRESDIASGFAQVEAALERADLADSYGNPEAAWALLDAVEGRPDLNLNDRFSLALQLSRYLSRRGRHEEAFARLTDARPSGAVPGQAVAALAAIAYVAVGAGSADGNSKALEALQAARLQGAEHWRRIAELLRASCASNEEFASTIKSVGASSLWNVTFIADLIGRRLDDLDEQALAVAAAASRLHPGRWRFVLREQVTTSAESNALNAARILESIGERSDIKRLRSYARRHRRMPGASGLGRALARQLADRVYIEDQNKVTIHVGGRLISGSTIRRKVLALLCFLLTKPDLAATRDQVLDALWPDLDPVDAVNSLNQTVYFLRRILEEDYVDDLSPGYLHHDSDLIWFDQELVTSRSNECRRLIRGLPSQPSPDQVFQLIGEYGGRFALDFDYEEWASPYRDWLHASFLEIVERELTTDIETGHFERGIRVARRALETDPAAEQVEVSLLRLYRASGAHAAAAEQYGHYAAVMRDQLGIDPPALDTL
jgi:LuxR family maltose regulon positive regulatory protein